MSNRVKIADLKFDPENARVRTAKGEERKPITRKG